jgi:cytochrome c5
VSTKRRLSSFLAAGVLLAGAIGAWAQSDQEKALIERIKPVGEVCIEGDATCAAPVAAVASGPRGGDQVYTSACFACHDSGVGGAPKIGDKEDWAARVAQGEETLVTHAIAGFTGSKGMMPPKGTCMQCSDEEIKLAIEYILSRSQ